MADINHKFEHVLTPEYWGGIDVMSLDSFADDKLFVLQGNNPRHTTLANSAWYLGKFLDTAVENRFKDTHERKIDNQLLSKPIDLAHLDYPPRIMLIERESLHKDFPTRDIAKYTDHSKVAEPMAREILPYWHAIHSSTDRIKRWGDHIVFRDEYAQYYREWLFGVAYKEEIQKIGTATISVGGLITYHFGAPKTLEFRGRTLYSVKKPDYFKHDVALGQQIGEIHRVTRNDLSKIGRISVSVSRVISAREVTIDLPRNDQRQRKTRKLWLPSLSPASKTATI